MLQHKLDDEFDREAKHPQAEREENNKLAESACAGILAQAIHDVHHVQHQAADTDDE